MRNDAPAIVTIPRPRGIPMLRMEWRSLAFFHWAVEPAAIQRLLPAGLQVDTFDGRAWVGLVPFTMRDVVPACVPRLPGLGDIPALSAFHECNVRTYVHPVGRPDLAGIWFFSLDAASRPAVFAARKFVFLPYFHARIELDRQDNEVRYSVDRLDPPSSRMRCRWRIGEPLPPSKPGELTHFLTERYALFSSKTIGRRTQLYRCPVWHKQWPLRRGELLELDDGLMKIAGIDVDYKEKALLHCADDLIVHAWRLHRVKQ